MTAKANILAHFSGEGSDRPIYLPDLTLWYDWRRKKESFPAQWADYTLPQIARALGVPIWLVAQPKRLLSADVAVTTTQEDGERIIRSETSAGSLVARWKLGPDGAWWQTEYPVKAAADLAAVLELAKARTYVTAANYDDLAERVGDDGIVAMEIPRRPFSDLLHEYLGWGEGLMLLSDERATIEEICAILEEKLQRFVQEVAQLPGRVIFSPDNLDGQFISPNLFRQYLADSYLRTAETAHRRGKHLLVHVGGPANRLLAPLTASGVDGLEGVAGPPQSDASLAQARDIAGPALTLWGGIPQDFLLDTHDWQDFEDSVRRTVEMAVGDGRMIIGIADRVPVDAELSRLEAIPALVKAALMG